MFTQAESLVFSILILFFILITFLLILFILHLICAEEPITFPERIKWYLGFSQTKVLSNYTNKISSNEIKNELESFHSIPKGISDFSRKLRQIIAVGTRFVVPSLLIVGVIYLEFQDSREEPFDLLAFSMVVFVVLTIIVGHISILFIPEVLGELWGIIEPNNKPEEYKKYIENFQKQLNNKNWLVLGIFGAAIGAWSVREAFFIWTKIIFLDLSESLVTVYHWMNWIVSTIVFIVGILVGLTIGLITWRICVTGNQIRQFAEKIDVEEQLGYHDQCWGLSSITKTFSPNAFLLVLWIGDLLFWILIGLDLFGNDSGEFFIVFSIIFAILIIISWFSIVYPIFAIHRTMISTRNRINKRLFRLEQEFRTQLDHYLKQDKPSPSSSPDKSKIEEQLLKFERKRTSLDYYNLYQNYPVWPVKVWFYFSIEVISIISLIGSLFGIVFNF